MINEQYGSPTAEEKLQLEVLGVYQENTSIEAYRVYLSALRKKNSHKTCGICPSTDPRTLTEIDHKKYADLFNNVIPHEKRIHEDTDEHPLTSRLCMEDFKYDDDIDTPYVSNVITNERNVKENTYYDITVSIKHSIEVLPEGMKILGQWTEFITIIQTDIQRRMLGRGYLITRYNDEVYETICMEFCKRNYLESKARVDNLIDIFGRCRKHEILHNALKRQAEKRIPIQETMSDMSLFVREEDDPDKPPVLADIQPGKTTTIFYVEHIIPKSKYYNTYTETFVVSHDEAIAIA